jgi:gliding motility-associated-like protein
MKFLLNIISLALFLVAFTANAQLPAPNLTVVATDESCDGSGQLTFTTSNTAPGATLVYSVFLQPANTLVHRGPETVVTLPAGTYTVTLEQTLGSESNVTTVRNIVVRNSVGALSIDVAQANDPCGGGTQLIVTVLEGTAIEYELVSGPVTRPRQASNIFSGLLPGTYVVRVYDACGGAVPRTFTLTAPNLSPPEISGPFFEDVLSTGCDSVLVTNVISYNQNTIIVYPLTVVYTLHPGDGSPDQVFTQTVTSGNPMRVEVMQAFTVVPGRIDTYDIQVTNGCNMVFPPRTGMVTTPVPQVGIQKTEIPCGQYYLTVVARNFVPPYDIEFLTPPVADFNPLNFNPQANQFTAMTTQYGGVGNPVPEGLYTVEITDVCGRVGTASIEIVYLIPEPSVQGNNNGCYSPLGYISASVPARNIVSAFITIGPPEFAEATPYDVSSFIANGVVIVPDLPTGDYTIIFTDDCGQPYEEEVNIPEFSELNFVASTRPDCTPGLGGVIVSSQNGDLLIMEVTAAPVAFNGGVTPLDVSEFIGAGGDLYLDNLPEGNYRFEGTDACGIYRFVDITVTGAVVAPDSAVRPIPGCNAFDLELDDRTAVDSASYWLQVENPAVPGEWTSPETGAVYPEGTVPNSTNSVQLANNQVNINFDYSGNFRVVKAYRAIGRGVASKDCVSVISVPFEYSSLLEIINVYTLSCQQNDVYIEATGFPPLKFGIDQRDGLPFTIDNGSNPVFSGLAPGSYRFWVENDCGEVRTRTSDIGVIPPLVVRNDADDMQQCIEVEDSPFQPFNFDEQTPQILGSQSPLIYSVTYHLTAADAATGNNPVNGPYTNTANPQTIYARVAHRLINLCVEIIDFQIRTTFNPVLNIPEQQYLCVNAGSLVLSANPGYDDYQWTSTHPITQLTDDAIEVFEPGIYTVTVRRIFGDFPACTATATIEVLLSEIPQNITFEIKDWTENDNSIRVIVGNIGNYQYSLDGENYQDSPLFSGLDTGLYTVYIKDILNCGTVIREVLLLNYPKFFTPNGDGTHETWHIRLSRLEPGLLVYIYDRFGKLITNFDADSEGWDGTFNGQPLPATDYWFVVNRQDGRVLKGHFSLMR